RRQRVYSSSVNASRDGECGFSAKQVQFLVLRMNRARMWHGASKELAAITLPIPLTSVDINHQACRVSELAREHVWTGGHGQRCARVGYPGHRPVRLPFGRVGGSGAIHSQRSTVPPSSV